MSLPPLDPTPRLNVNEALSRLSQLVKPLTRVESLPSADSHGRFLVDSMYAPINLPPFTNSAMDGYAVRYQDLSPPQQVLIQGTSAAGHPYPDSLLANHCIRIFTGAQLPAGADTVLLQENVSRVDNAILVSDPIVKGSHIRQTGHDVIKGERLFAPKTRINHFSLAWLTACGITEIKVTDKPIVAIFSTGDELKNVGEELLPGQIYDANRLAVKSLLSDLPVEIVDFGIIADNQKAIVDTINKAAKVADAIITSGGVSVGDADFVRLAVQESGSLDFWQLNLKPGKPFAYGCVEKDKNGNQCYFFGLPGNPISTIVTLLLLAKPALRQLCGGQMQAAKIIPAIAKETFTHSAGRDEYQRGSYLRDQQATTGKLYVTSTGDQSSNRFASFNHADCLVWIDKDRGSVKPGEVVNTLSLTDLIYG